MGARAKIIGSTNFVPEEAPDTGNAQTYALASDVDIQGETNSVAQLRIDADDFSAGTPPIIHIGLGHTGGTFTAPSGGWATGTLTMSAAHGQDGGDAVQFSTTGTLPLGLAPATPFIVHAVPSPTQMIVGLPGGSSTLLSDSGTGVHSWASVTTGIMLTYENLPGGPTTPILVKDRRGGIPDDFSKIRGLQLYLMPTDPALVCSGKVCMQMGDAGDPMSYIVAPLEILSVVGDAGPPVILDPLIPRAVATFALPCGAPYADGSTIDITILQATNLTILLNLFGK